MKLLVTGGAGFIGSAVVRKAIIDRGYSVINVDKLTYAANLDNLRELPEDAPYTFVQADIADQAAIDAILRDHTPDAVMHLAAESHVDRSIDGPDEFIRTNIVGTFSLLQATRRYLGSCSAEVATRFRFHHVSTDEVFGSLPAVGKFTETTPYAPRSPYSASKASSDMLVRAWADTFKLPVVITNCSNNYGPYQFPEKLVPVVTLNALHGRKIPVYGDGLNVRDWLHVDDHAEALLQVLERGRLGETYNVGGDNEMSNIELVREICRIMDARFPERAPHDSLIEMVKDRPGHDFRYAIDASKVQRELGWRPEVKGVEGLEQTVAWYIDNEWWWRPLEKGGHTNMRLGTASR